MDAIRDFEACPSDECSVVTREVYTASQEQAVRFRDHFHYDLFYHDSPGSFPLQPLRLIGSEQNSTSTAMMPVPTGVGQHV